MAILDVLLLGNPKLREKSLDVKNFNTDLKKELQDIKDTLSFLQDSKKLGRAIATPQVGIMKKIIYFQLSNKSFYMVNPKITRKSETLIFVWDSCYSFDIAFFVKIQRHKAIKVEYQNEIGAILSEEFSDDLSELVQHEIDHLQGILAIDHLKDPKKIIMRSEWEKKHK